MTPEQVRSLLQEHDALREGHFVLSSGRHSSRYLQCAVALQHPQVAETLGRALVERLQPELDDVPSVVVSPALGGLIIGHEVGRAFSLRACFTERVDGEMVLRRGFQLAARDNVVLVEDVVTTGLSSRETLAAIRASGATPVAAACIANRSGLEHLDGLPLVSLLQLDVPSWPPEDCPQCAAGASVIRPGSRA